jgi:hypothetical protein
MYNITEVIIDLVLENALPCFRNPKPNVQLFLRKNLTASSIRHAHTLSNIITEYKNNLTYTAISMVIKMLICRFFIINKPKNNILATILVFIHMADYIFYN